MICPPLSTQQKVELLSLSSHGSAASRLLVQPALHMVLRSGAGIGKQNSLLPFACPVSSAMLPSLANLGWPHTHTSAFMHLKSIPT